MNGSDAISTAQSDTTNGLSSNKLVKNRTDSTVTQVDHLITYLATIDPKTKPSA